MPSGKDWVKRLMDSTQKNYDIAASFYEQRQNLFFDFYSKQYNFKMEEVLKIAGESIETEWNQLLNNTLNAPSTYSNTSILNSLHSFNRRHNLGIQINNFTNKNKEAIGANLGNLYEPYLKNSIQTRITNTIRTQVNAVVNSLGTIDTQVTGKISGSSAVTKQKSSIRPDIMIMLSNYQILNQNGEPVLPSIKKSADTITIELNELIDIHDLWTKKNDITKEDFIKGKNTVLDKYLMEDFSYAGGLNLKYWEGDGHGKRFSNSSVLFSLFNQKMQNGGANKSGTYSNGVAYAHDFLFLSRYLINIISPLNVGFYSGSNVLFTSDFLHNYYLYFQLNYKKDENQAEDRHWHHYQATNDTITLYSMNQAKKKRSLLYRLQNASVYVSMNGTIDEYEL